MPVGLVAFQESHPDTSLSLSVTKCEQIFSGLLSGDFDIGVTGLAPKNRSLHKIKLFDAPLVIFQAGTIKPATEKKTNLKRLLKARLILREKDSGCGVAFENFLGKNRIHLQEFSMISESDSNEAIKNLVKKATVFQSLSKILLTVQERNNPIFFTVRAPPGSEYGGDQNGFLWPATLPYALAPDVFPCTEPSFCQPRDDGLKSRNFPRSFR